MQKPPEIGVGEASERPATRRLVARTEEEEVGGRLAAPMAAAVGRQKTGDVPPVSRLPLHIEEVG